jgi:hypothetical protein
MPFGCIFTTDQNSNICFFAHVIYFLLWYLWVVYVVFSNKVFGVLFLNFSIFWIFNYFLVLWLFDNFWVESICQFFLPKGWVLWVGKLSEHNPQITQILPLLIFFLCHL